MHIFEIFWQIKYVLFKHTFAYFGILTEILSNFAGKYAKVGIIAMAIARTNVPLGYARTPTSFIHPRTWAL